MKQRTIQNHAWPDHVGSGVTRSVRLVVTAAVTAAVALMLPRLALASQTLSVTRYAQETRAWCWAASGKMVMKYLGRTVSQCTQAKDYLNQSSCPCNACVSSPSSTNPCLKGGWPDFKEYGFSCQKKANAALTWTQLKNALGIGPFVFSWKWVGGGGHMMVAYGWFVDSGTNYVMTIDPLPDCASSGSDFYTYDDYKAKAGQYSHWHDLYNVHKPPAGDTPSCSLGTRTSPPTGAARRG